MAIFITVATQAQIASSPFSQIGIGDLYSNALAQNQGMGGVGISNPSGSYINNQNPALLVFNRITVFQAGMQFENRKASDGVNTQSFATGNLNYLAIAFPIINGKLSTSVGLMPYSHVNYNLSYSSVADGSNTAIQIQEKGTGGVDQLYWATGLAISRSLSLGVRATYLFSSIVTNQSNPFVANLGTYSSIYFRDSYHGLNLSGGLSFHKDSLFHKNYRLNVGLVYSLASHLKAQHLVRYQLNSTSGAIVDSVTVAAVGQRMTLPQNYGIGISFGQIDKWMIGGDFTYLDYRSYTGPLSGPISTHNYINSTNIVVPTIGFRTGAGIEYTPDYLDFTNYISRITYRAGFSYEKSPFLLNNYGWTDMGGTFGMSLPVGRFSSIDLGLKIGKRGTVAQNTLTENYFRLYFGITFNDQWFIKRKFD